MLFTVRRMRLKGVPLSRLELDRSTAEQGDVRIEEQRAEQFGRLVRVATLYARDRQVGPLQLPRLYDVQLLWMSPMAMVLGGLELDGCAALAQSWYCTPSLPGAG